MYSKTETHVFFVENQLKKFFCKNESFVILDSNNRIDSK